MSWRPRRKGTRSGIDQCLGDLAGAPLERPTSDPRRAAREFAARAPAEPSWNEKRAAQLRGEGLGAEEAWRRAQEEGREANASPGARRDTPAEPSASAARPLHEVAELDDETIARVDALAAGLGVTREEALVLCAERGLEEMLGPPPSGRKGGA